MRIDDLKKISQARTRYVASSYWCVDIPLPMGVSEQIQGGTGSRLLIEPWQRHLVESALRNYTAYGGTSIPMECSQRIHGTLSGC